VRRIPVVPTSAGRKRLDEIASGIVMVVAVVGIVLAAAGAYFFVGGTVGVFAVLIAYALFQGSSNDCGVCDGDREPADEREYTQLELENGVHLRDSDS
jgi:NaMN:DMB phosphoribosyltransferase